MAGYEGESAGSKFAPVILAGGSGTRFWPRSRRTRAKQVLALDGESTMIQQTLERLLPLAAADAVWVITNSLLDETIAGQLPDVPRANILSEPSARNTAPACALAAFLLEPNEPDTVIGIFPSDHVVKDQARFTEVIGAGVALAASGETIVVLGVPPTRAETGYGYIELGEALDSAAVPCGEVQVRRVKRFTEKPDRAKAEEFVASGNYVWNGGIFLWSARTLANAIREHSPAMAPLLEKIAAAHGASESEFEKVFAELYPQCENISIDYAVLERRSAKGELKAEIYCLPADFAWNDLGSWASLHEHVAACAPHEVAEKNVCDGAKSIVTIDARGNYVFAPGKVVALVGVHDLVVVETEDALLITTRERSQDVGKVVAELKGSGRKRWFRAAFCGLERATTEIPNFVQNDACSKKDAPGKNDDRARNDDRGWGEVSVMAEAAAVKFGTDGWRGIIADDFTYANVRVAARAIAHYVLAHEDPKRGVCIGWDTRFGSQSFARVVAQVLSEAGIPVALASEVTPTPALSYAVRERKAAGGVMITSSHNPAEWNGVKYKASYGGSGRPAIIASIESYLNVPLPVPERTRRITEVNFNPEYITAIARFVDLRAIKESGYKFLIDCMYGAGRGVIAGIFTRLEIPFVEIRSEINPAFPGINPEPILPHIRESQIAVVANKCDAGMITDGDADRIGAVDEHGNVVDAHKIFAILLKWLLERKQWPGDVTRAFNTTKMLDRIAAKHGRTLHEHGIGFKYVCDLMLTENILIGGEESGGVGISKHLPERDGLLNSLLIANVMADEKKTLGQLVASLQEEFGEHQYGRIDMHIDEELKQSAIARARETNVGDTMAGMTVLKVETMDGIKFFLENPACAGKPNAAETWLLLRASGTEPLLRVYCESCSVESVTAVLESARKFVLAGRSA